MNVTNFCLNVDIKVNLNYPNWGPPKLLLQIKTKISFLDVFFIGNKMYFSNYLYNMTGGIYVEKEIPGTLDINSQLVFFKFLKFLIPSDPLLVN